MMNKKGEERILFFYMAVIWIMIALAIVYGVFLFYGEEQDINQLQADILADRLLGCFVESGNLLEIQDVYTNCNLDAETFNSEKFYFKIDFIDLQTNENFKESVVGGNLEINSQCILRSKGSAGEHFASCSNKEVVVNFNDKDISLNVLTGVNNFGGSL